MKKVLLLSLSLVLGLGAMAQEFAPKTQRVAKKDAKSMAVEHKNATKVAFGKEAVAASAEAYAPQNQSVVSTKDDDYMTITTINTFNDIQSNGWTCNRMVQFNNGALAVVATMSRSETQPSGADRGTGYNYFDGEFWGDVPEERVEPERTGWPTIAQWGETGEVFISHAPLKCYTREVAGEGEWVCKGLLPNSPEGYEYDDDASWPRIATSGDNHEIIHMIADIQHGFGTGIPSYDSVYHDQVYYRSVDGGETWETHFSPLAQDGDQRNVFTADNYNISANGHTVAILYADALTNHLIMYKSTNDGETWERRIVWENPIYGLDWNTDSAVLTLDSVGYNMPASSALTVDKNGVVHVATSVYYWEKYQLDEYYSPYYGRTVDGIAYWNDNQPGPIQSKDGLAKNALKLWWDDEENPGYMKMDDDTVKWIGYMPMYQGYTFATSGMYTEDDYYNKIRLSASAMPALSVDEFGNMACAYTAPCDANSDSNGKYFRKLYVSFWNNDEGYWHQCEMNLIDEDEYPELTDAETFFTFGADQVTTPGLFWFGCMNDYKIGITTDGDNMINVYKVLAPAEFVSVPENTAAQDVVYSIYPNPATDNYIIVKSAQKVDATISIVNLVGQTVSKFNQTLEMGANTVNIDLKSGVYFCTISANGFDRTVKFVVK